MRTNGIDNSKERRLIELLYDLNAKVVRVEEQVKALSSVDDWSRSEMDKVCKEMNKLRNEIDEIKKEVAKLSMYMKIISAGVGMVVMVMLSNIDKIIGWIRRW